jgi:hypothetical protein
MAGRIIEEEEANVIAICLAFKDVDCQVHLRKEVLSGEVPITILPSLEEDTGFPVQGTEQEKK